MCDDGYCPIQDHTIAHETDYLLYCDEFEEKEEDP